MQQTRLGNGTQKMVMSLMGGDTTESNAFAKELNAKLSMAAKMAQANKYETEANLNNQLFNNRKAGSNQFMQGATNLSQPQLDIMNAFAETGKYLQQQRAEGAPTAAGVEPMMNVPTDMKPQWLTPDVQSKYSRARMATGANNMGTGKSKANDIMTALLDGAKLNNQDRMISGTLDPNRVAPAMGASEGKPTVDVTGSGIGFNPYGDKANLNTKPFIDKANIDAKAKIDAALSRGGINGGQLPAEAKMVNFYMGKGYKKEEAIELARSRKNVPIRVLASEIYANERENLMLSPIAKTMNEQEQEAYVEDRVIKTIQFLQNNEKRFGGGKDNDPMGLRP